MRELSQRRAEDSGATVAERLAVLLVELAEQYGALTTRGVTLSFAQRELARMVGGSRASVARALRDLRKRGLITMARRKVTILRLDALRELAA